MYRHSIKMRVSTQSNRLAACVIFVSALAATGIRGECYAGQADVAFLLEGVSRIAAPGVPGPLSVFGDEAFPVIAVSSEGKNREAVVAAARLGRGRIVCLGHPGLSRRRGVRVRGYGPIHRKRFALGGEQAGSGRIAVARGDVSPRFSCPMASRPPCVGRRTSGS